MISVRPRNLSSIKCKERLVGLIHIDLRLGYPNIVTTHVDILDGNVVLLFFSNVFVYFLTVFENRKQNNDRLAKCVTLC